MAARLGVHVLGPRYGEAIILELPDGGVGVIDSFAAASGPHPVVEFLGATFPSLPGLRFFAITHPHADHCLRAAEILDRYRPAEFWVFHPFPAGQVGSYYTALARHGARERVEVALALPVGSVAESLLQLHLSVRQPIKQGHVGFRHLTAGQPSATFSAGQVRVHYLTPAGRSQFAYADAVEEAGRRIFTDGPALRAANQLPHVDHNLASGAILVRYGSTRVLLMADTEHGRWEEWLASDPAEELRQPVHFLKAAHHGSANGYHNPFFAACADPTITLAVMTPFHHGGVSLPTADGIRLVRPHVNSLFCTNRGLARVSTGLNWEPVNPPSTLTLPRRWASMIARKVALRRLLVNTGIAPGETLPSMPRTWAADILRAPELGRLLRPEARPAAVPVPAGLACTVSAYYDSRGNRVELRVGADAGRLV